VLRLATTLFVLTALASTAAATLSEALSLDELRAASEHIVLGEVVRRQARREPTGRIVTDVEVRVLESLRGDAQPGETLAFMRLGGILGDLGMQVAGAPTFEGGGRYVLFLRRLGSGVLRPVGMSQGVMPVTEDGRGRTVRPGGAGLGLVRRDGQGTLRPAAPALTEPMPYPALRERLLSP
jgi:hypothetical protein